VNGVNPDGVVRGSGIFAGGWGAQRAKVYGVEEEELGAFYAKRTILGREVLPEHVANAVFALTAGELSHTTALHVPVDGGLAAAYLREEPWVPPIHHMQPSTSVPPAAGSSQAGSSTANYAPRRPSGFPTALWLCAAATVAPCTGTYCPCTPVRCPVCAEQPRNTVDLRRWASIPGPWTTGCWTATGTCWATRSTTVMHAPTESPSRSSAICLPKSCTRSTDCKYNRSTPCSSSWRPPGTPRWPQPTHCCSSPTCSVTGSPENTLRN